MGKGTREPQRTAWVTSGWHGGVVGVGVQRLVRLFFSVRPTQTTTMFAFAHPGLWVGAKGGNWESLSVHACFVCCLPVPVPSCPSCPCLVWSKWSGAGRREQWQNRWGWGKPTINTQAHQAIRIIPTEGRTGRCYMKTGKARQAETDEPTLPPTAHVLGGKYYT